jgi:hypothetical protein
LVILLLLWCFMQSVSMQIVVASIRQVSTPKNKHKNSPPPN